jgi:hypothetical protein
MLISNFRYWFFAQVSCDQQGEQGLQADGGGPGQDDRVPEVCHEQSPQRDRLSQDLLQRLDIRLNLRFIASFNFCYIVRLSKNCQNKKIINGILNLDKNERICRNITAKFVLNFF